MLRNASIVVLATALGASMSPALANVVVVTQERALAGNIAPGDAPGFPVTLTKAGSYRLGSNLRVPAGETGIKIDARRVSIDLNGFQIRGVSGARFGIFGSSDSATIRNGTIAGFARGGIAGTGKFWMIKQMRVVDNGRTGIRCDEACIVERSVVARNGLNGIEMGSGIVLGNTIADNVGFGIQGAEGGEGVGFGDNTLSENAGGAAVQIAGGVAEMNTNLCVTETEEPDTAC
jgi:hypothetical protein